MIIAISVTLFFLILRFSVTVFNFISNPKLTRVNKAYTDLVSILIPVRDEAGNILNLLQSIQNQDYKNYEVIIYDDESTDNTLTICEAFSKNAPRFRVIKGGSLPAGWTGKNHACYQLAQQAKGDQLLFLDARQQVNKSLINSAVHRMHLYKLGLLSLFSDQQMLTIGERTTIPLINYLLLNLVPLRLVYIIKYPVIATAGGQFMLFNAEAYRRHQWHSNVRDKVAEATEIMKLVKAEKYNGEVLLANGMLNSRKFNSYSEAIGGLSRAILPTFNYSVIGLLLYILLVIGGPLILIITLNINLIFYMAGLIMLTRVMISFLSRQNPFFNMLLHPLQMLNLLFISFLSIQKHLTKKETWKGRSL